jgi:hypothetical protein
MTNEAQALPWRGPGEGRPETLPLPPGRMPMRRGGRMLKRWRYVAAFADELLLCAARVQVGPLGQTFWLFRDRHENRTWERTRLRLPGARGEVWTEAAEGEGSLEHAANGEVVVRVEASGVEEQTLRAFLRLGEGSWVESVCPTVEGHFAWTRKRADIPVECDLRIGGDRIRADARGVEDESAGYHPRHTVWSWSAGVGTTTDGRSVGWNLVEGINDPPARSERAIWVDGVPFEPGPVSFDGLDGIGFDDGSRLGFTGECERAREENLLLVRYRYRQPFGSFTGSLPGGLELASGTGVMEHHDAHW